MYTVEIVKNRFWIVEDAGVKLGLIRKTESSVFEVIINETREHETLDFNALTSKYGSKILESKQVKKIESVGKDSGYAMDQVNGYPCKHRAFNKSTDDKNIPIYTTKENSTVFYAAGYFAIRYPSDWRWFYGGKRETLNTYDFMGPWKTKSEMQSETLLANKREGL